MKRIPLIIVCAIIVISCNQISDYKKSFQLAKIKTANKDYKEAIDLLDKIISLEPNFDSAYIERSYNYLQINKPEQALTDINQAIQINFTNISAYFIRGLIYSYISENEKAINDFSHIIKLGDETFIIVALQERARVFHDLGENNKSIDDYSRIILLDSLNYEAYVSRGIVRVNNNFSGVFKDSEKMALNEKMNNSHFLRQKGDGQSIDVHESISKNNREAIADFSTAIRIKQDYSFAYYNRGNVFVDLGLDKDALEDFNKAIEFDKKSDYYMARASLYKSLKEYTKSLNDFNVSIELDPQNGFAYFNRGLLKEELKDFKSAEKDFRKAEELGVNIY